MNITISKDRDIPPSAIIALYESVNWSAAKKPNQLIKGLQNSHSLLTAWDEDRLVGLCNAISDGHLVVYFPHLLVHPDYHGQGIGKILVQELEKIYEDFHMQMLTADGASVKFYKKMGFAKAGDTVPMWKYAGDEH